MMELVAVIVILAVLGAIALPRFLELGSDARVASLRSAAGALRAGAEAARFKCQLQADCGGDQAATSGSLRNPDGVAGVLKFGYPTGLSRVPSFFGIKDWVRIGGGLKLTERGGDFTTVITAEGARDPANCQVTYTTTALVVAGMQPDIQLRTTGC